MKNIFVGVLFALATSFASAQVQLSVSDVKAVPGSKVLVPIAISEGKDISGIQFVLNFEADVLSVPDDKSAVRGEALADHNIGANRQGNQFNIVVFSSSLARLKAGGGVLMNVLFQVPSTATNGRATTIRLSDIQASDAGGNAIGVTTKDGTVFIGTDTNTPTPGANELVFPQIANGSFPGGSFFTTLIFVNRTGAVTTGEARFFKSDGTPFTVKLTDGRSGSSFTFTVLEGGSAFLQTDGSGPISAGYARVSATGPLGGTILFTQLDGTGKTIAEAGVGASSPGTRFSIPVLYQKGAADTGIAFVNISGQAAELTLTLRDKAGTIISSQKTVLSAGQHLPRFATEYFSSLASQPDFSGSIEASTPVEVTAVALKLQGKLITTFPVIPAQYVPSSSANPVPTVSSLNPASAAAGSSGFTLTVRGTNFASGSSVRWNGSDRATTFVSATQLTAAIPASDIASVGTAGVSVFNPAPGGGTSNALVFTINPSVSPNPVPTVSGLTPTSATAGGAAFALTINGTSFVTSSVARWNGSDRVTTFVSAAQLTAAIGASDIGTAGTASVAVFNPAPGGGVSNALTFTIGSAGTAPTINDVKVTSVSIDSAKVDVQLTDPDGDVVKLEFTWYRQGTPGAVKVLNSPADVNLAGVKSGTISYTFTGIGVSTPFGTVSPDRVDVQATDARGLKSNVFSKTF